LEKTCRLSRVGLCVFLSVCLSVYPSGKRIVAQWLIGSGCRLYDEWGRSRDSCIRCGPRAPRGRGSFGAFWDFCWFFESGR